MNPSLRRLPHFVLVLLFLAAPQAWAQTAADFHRTAIEKYNKGDYAAAIADFDRAIALKSDNPDYFNNRGLTKDNKGDNAGAIADYDRAIALKSDNYSYFYSRGLAKKLKGDYADAIADFDRAIALKPDYAPAYRMRGNIRQATGNFEVAIADYDKAIALTQDGGEYVRFYRYVTLRRLQRANPFAELARNVASWKDGWTKTVGLFLVEAISEPEFFAKAAAGDPKTVREQQCDAYYFAGMARLQAGDRTAAKEYFEKCLATQVTNFSEFDLARAELGWLAPATK